jgi:hypothetical protein
LSLSVIQIFLPASSFVLSFIPLGLKYFDCPLQLEKIEIKSKNMDSVLFIFEFDYSCPVMLCLPGTIDDYDIILKLSLSSTNFAKHFVACLISFLYYY